MSGHPSFIPKGGGHGRGPGGHGHGPGGHGPAARMMGGEKALAFGPTMRRMLSFMGQFKGRLLLVLLFAVASTAFSIVGPKVLSEATTVLFDGAVASAAGTGSIDFDAIGRILLATLALYLLSAACSWVQSWVMSYISQQTCYRLRDAIAKKIDRVPFGYFEKTSTGDTLSRITNDVDTLGQSLNQGITQAITSAVTVVGVLVMMLSINWIMTLVALVMVPVSMALVAVVVRLSQKHFVAQQRLLGALNGRVEETFSGHAVVRAFGREDETVRAYEADNEALYNAGWKAQFLSGLMMPVLGFVGNLGYVAVAVTGAFFAVAGTITVGDIQAFVQYVKNFTQPITQLAQISNVLQSLAAAAERIFAFLDLPEVPKEASAVDPAALFHRRGIRRRALRLHARCARHPQLLRSRGLPGANRGHRRPHGRRQDHHGEAAHALLRRGRGRHPHRRRPTSASFPAPMCGICSPWCCRIRGCSPAPCARTSATGGLMPPMGTWKRPRARPAPTISSACCPAVTTSRSTRTRAT